MPRILICLFLICRVCVLQAQMPSPDRLALHELAKLSELHQDAKTLSEVAKGHPVALVHGRATVGFIGRLHEDISTVQWRSWAEEHPSVDAGACRAGIVSFRIDAYNLDVLEELPMTMIELASRAVPDVNKARYGTRVDSVHAGLDLPHPYHGEGVLIGVLDWGFDYTHPMFYDTTMTSSRIRAVWDQYRQAGPSPEGYGYGTAAYTPVTIQSMGSDTANVYSYSTHGTHVAGIAAGGGAGVGLTGMAPASELLFATLMVDEAAALDAFEWMAGVAEADGKRLVINNSWGLPQWGTPDGTGLSSQFIDDLSTNGVVFVSSNGNNGDSNFHIDHSFSGPGDTIRSRVQFYPLSANPNAWGQNLTLWGETGESFEAGFALTQGISSVVSESPMYHTAQGPLVLDTIHVANGDTLIYDVAMESSHPNNDRPFLQIRIHKGTSNLAVVLQVTAESGRVHAWNHTHLSNDVGNWGQNFQAAQSSWLAGNPLYGVQQPASGLSVIAVGAYSSEHQNSQGTEVGGSLAYFSSYGPTLDERLKPNVSAPGVNVESALSSFRDGSYSTTNTVAWNGQPYDFGKLSGTSMSSPATTGVVALMLEANPSLTPEDVKTILAWTAREDDDTGSIPAQGDDVWGHGKVTASQAVMTSIGWISNVGLPDPHSQTHEGAPLVYPNPFKDELWVAGMSSAGGLWTVLDMRGTVILSGNASTWFQIDMTGIPAGAYVVQTSDPNGRVEAVRVVKIP